MRKGGFTIPLAESFKHRVVCLASPPTQPSNSSGSNAGCFRHRRVIQVRMPLLAPPNARGGEGHPSAGCWSKGAPKPKKGVCWQVGGASRCGAPPRLVVLSLSRMFCPLFPSGCWVSPLMSLHLTRTRPQQLVHKVLAAAVLTIGRVFRRSPRPPPLSAASRQVHVQPVG